MNIYVLKIPLYCSAKETGFNSLRVVGFTQSTVVTASQVCTEIRAFEEFEPLIRIGKSALAFSSREDVICHCLRTT